MHKVISTGIVSRRLGKVLKMAPPWQNLAALVLFVVFLLPQAAWSDTNVALNKEVTLNGTFFVGGWGQYTAPKETVVNGTFLPEGTEWDIGSVWWNSSYYGN
jgi:hypothetical protein